MTRVSGREPRPGVREISPAKRRRYRRVGSAGGRSGGVPARSSSPLQRRVNRITHALYAQLDLHDIWHILVRVRDHPRYDALQSSPGRPRFLRRTSRPEFASRIVPPGTGRDRTSRPTIDAALTSCVGRTNRESRTAPVHLHPGPPEAIGETSLSRSAPSGPGSSLWVMDHSRSPASAARYPPPPARRRSAGRWSPASRTAILAPRRRPRPRSTSFQGARLRHGAPREEHARMASRRQRSFHAPVAQPVVTAVPYDAASTYQLSETIASIQHPTSPILISLPRRKKTLLSRSTPT